MRAFHRTVLMRDISTSRINVVTEFLEQCTNFRVVVEFTTLIEANALVGNRGRMADEPLAETVDGSTFGDADGAVEGTREVVWNINKTGFAIESFASSSARFILRSR
jgi:hypothetical protein